MAPKKQDELRRAFANRLNALAERGGKTAIDVRMCGALIFSALVAAYPKPEIGDAMQKAIRDWEMGKHTNDAMLGADFVASLVRMTKLRLGIGGRKHSECEAIENAIGVTYDELPAFEKRAADIVMGRARAARNNSKDPASRIAVAVRNDWARPVPALRPKGPVELSIKTIVETAIPFLDDLAGEEIRGGTPDEDYDPAKMEPAGLGALIALARMAYPDKSNEEPRVNIEYVCDIISEYRRSHPSISI